MSFFKSRLFYALAVSIILVLCIWYFNTYKQSLYARNTDSSLSVEKRDYYKNLAQESSGKAMRELRRDSAHDKVILKFCHTIAHDIGRIAMIRAGDFGKAVADQDLYCNSGYLHGVIEELLASRQLTKESIEQVCSPSIPFSYVDWQCAHGIGHGIMYANGDNLVHALDLCETLDGQETRESCINGVFMEQFNEDGIEKINKENLFDACSGQKDEYKKHCYLYASAALLLLNSSDYESAFNACKTVGEKYQSVCFQGIGGELMKRNLDNIKFVESICSNSEHYDDCVSGASSYVFFNFGSARPMGFICIQFSERGQKICTEVKTSLSELFPVKN